MALDEYQHAPISMSVPRLFSQFGFFLRRSLEYIEVFGLSRGVRVLAGNFFKVKLAPRGARSFVATPRQGLVALRSRSSDLSVYWEIFVDGQYSIERLDVFQSLLERYRDIKKRGHTPLIIDVGANIGLAAVYFSALFPDADIALIEASTENFEMCLQNASERPRLKPLHYALWSKKTKLRLHESDGFSTVRVGESREERDAGSSVETITMQEVINLYPHHELFIVKMDIEGAESVVLSENNAWLLAKPIIFVEPHDSIIRHNKSLHGLLAIEAYQKAEIISQKSILVFVPEAA